MTSRLDDVEGVLFDLDGVAYVGHDAIPGAADALRHLDNRGIPYRFLTNTTTKSPASLHAKMTGMGLPIADSSLILTTHEVAASYLAAAGHPSCYLLVNDDAREAYHECPTDENKPAYVVIGDIGNGWNYDILNRVFNMVMDGSSILALHKGRYWRTEDGLQMDIGVFVSGLEYATGKTATVVGKPSSTFFDMGIQQLGVTKDRVIMIGDDIDTDVGGAQAAGIRGVLVKTGKYREDAVARSQVKPHATIDSIADIELLIG